MAEVIPVPGGGAEVIFDINDFLLLVEKHMGYEARRWLEEYLAEEGEDEC